MPPRHLITAGVEGAGKSEGFLMGELLIERITGSRREGP